VEDNIKMNFEDTGCDEVDWIQLTQDKGSIVGSCEHDGLLQTKIFLDQLNNFQLFKEHFATCSYKMLDFHIIYNFH
jgi:hypothetical protein